MKICIPLEDLSSSWMLYTLWGLIFMASTASLSVSYCHNFGGKKDTVPLKQSFKNKESFNLRLLSLMRIRIIYHKWSQELSVQFYSMKCQWHYFQIYTVLSHFRISSDTKNWYICLRETLLIKYEMIKFMILRKGKRRKST